MDFNQLSDQQVLEEIAQRVKRKRLNLNMTQQELARKAGVHVQTIKKFEAGTGSKLMVLIQIMRALEELDHIDSLLPEPGLSPIQLLKLKGKERSRARGSQPDQNTDSGW